jgi:hypothetical protein
MKDEVMRTAEQELDTAGIFLQRNQGTKLSTSVKSSTRSVVISSAIAEFTHTENIRENSKPSKRRY